MYQTRETLLAEIEALKHRSTLLWQRIMDSPEEDALHTEAWRQHGAIDEAKRQCEQQIHMNGYMMPIGDD